MKQIKIYPLTIPITEDTEPIIGILKTTDLSSSHWYRKLVKYEDDECWRASLNQEEASHFLNFSRSFANGSPNEEIDWQKTKTWKQKLSHAIRCLDGGY
jgi:hypothetical protein